MSAPKRSRRPFLELHVKLHGVPKLDSIGRYVGYAKTCACRRTLKTIAERRWHDDVFHPKERRAP